MRLTGIRFFFTMLGLTLSVVALSSLGSAQISSAQIPSTGDAYGGKFMRRTRSCKCGWEYMHGRFRQRALGDESEPRRRLSRLPAAVYLRLTPDAA